MDCELCKAKDEAYRTVYKDDLVFVVMNIEPVKHGHLMVLPIRHVEHLADLQADEAAAFLRAIDSCMQAVTKAYKETPMFLVNGWKHRSQSHLHGHVVPSQKPLRGLFAAAEGLEERKRASREELEEMTTKLRAVYE